MVNTVFQTKNLKMENEQIRIAVVGCCHGELDEIYRCIRNDEERTSLKVDLLLICGDFQAVRNYDDLHQMAVPPKFRKLNTFYKYYSGEETAPVLTVFIGGNHEASGFLQELPYGGWVAPNIYYLGYSGVVQFGGLRIAGLSGIFKPHDFNKGHYERPPYSEETKRSCYHVRAIDVYKMHHIKEDVDIFLSHDWPLGVYHFGNLEVLLRAKPYFYDEINRNVLGNPHTRGLLHALRPKFWFAAHLHCHFKANVPHGPIQQNGRPERFTKFSALNKVLPGRRFLEIFTLRSQLGTNQPKRLHYDPEWLAILRRTDRFMSLDPGYCQLPQEQPIGPSEDEKSSVLDAFQSDLMIPENFEHTSPPVGNGDQNRSAPEGDDRGSSRHGVCNSNKIYINPQTERLSQLLDIVHPFKVFSSPSVNMVSEKLADPNEINLDDDDEDAGDKGVVTKESDPNEIDVGDEDDDGSDDNKVTADEKSGPNEIDINDDDDDDDDEKHSDPIQVNFDSSDKEREFAGAIGGSDKAGVLADDYDGNAEGGTKEADDSGECESADPNEINPGDDDDDNDDGSPRAKRARLDEACST